MIWSKMQKIDVRIIYVLMILAIAVPMINPLAIPISVGSGTRKFYDEIEKINAGEKVLLSMDYSATGAPEIHPQAQAVMQHLMDRDIKVVMIGFWDAGPMFGDRLIRYFEAEAGKEYGIDFVNLGYLPGGQTAIKRFGEDVTTVTSDFHNNPVSSLPIMQGLKDARDFAAVICMAAGNPGIDEWIRQIQSSLNINFMAACVTVSAPQALPFVNSGQLTALLVGMRGAAEYEIITEKPGASVAKMDAQSLGHLLIIIFIIVGNVAFFMEQRQSDV